MASSSYNISTSDILDRYNGDKDLAASELVDRVRSGEIWFPYNRTFQLPPTVMFENLQNAQTNTEIKQNYRLYSYNPNFGSYLPPKFRDQQLLLLTDPNSFQETDALSDYFIEEIRLRAKRYDQQYSVMECWDQDECLVEIMKEALAEPFITPKSLRETFYKNIAETGIFNPSWAKSLLEIVMGTDLKDKKWLDISSGWGDRLLTAMALDMEYVGFDPNINLQPQHDAMIEMFGDPSRQRVIYEPFESGIIPTGPYDVVLTSPPYFNVEEYAPNQKGQSIVNYPEKNQWMVWFLFASLIKAWDNLKENGYLILHLGDSIQRDSNGKTIGSIATSEATNIFIENYLSQASWEGIIGIKGKSGFARPCWVWRKAPKGEPTKVWNPEPSYSGFGRDRQLKFSKRTLYNTYPQLQQELIRFYASKYSTDYVIRRKNCGIIQGLFPKKNNNSVNCLLISSLLETVGVDMTIQLCSDIYLSKDPNIAEKYAPYYNIRKNNNIIIRDYISRTNSSWSRKIVDQLLGDDLMLSCLLETRLGIEGTIRWAVAMMKLSFPR